MWHSEFAYNGSYGGCNVTYYNITKCPFEVETYNYLDILHLTGKKMKIDNNMLTAIYVYLPLMLKLSPFFKNFSISMKKLMNLT